MPFQVLSTQSASVAGTSSRTALTANNGEVLYLHTAAAATTTVFVKLGTVTTDALVTDFAIPPGSMHTLVVPPSVTHIAHIGSAAGPSTLYISRGHYY